MRRGVRIGLRAYVEVAVEHVGAIDAVKRDGDVEHLRSTPAPGLAVVDLSDQARAAHVRTVNLVIDARKPEQDGYAVVDDDLLARVAERLADDLDVFGRQHAAGVCYAVHVGDAVACAFGVFAGVLVEVPVGTLAQGVFGIGADDVHRRGEQAAGDLHGFCGGCCLEPGDRRRRRLLGLQQFGGGDDGSELAKLRKRDASVAVGCCCSKGCGLFVGVDALAVGIDSERQMGQAGRFRGAFDRIVAVGLPVVVEPGPVLRPDVSAPFEYERLEHQVEGERCAHHDVSRAR